MSNLDVYAKYGITNRLIYVGWPDAAFTGFRWAFFDAQGVEIPGGYAGAAVLLEVLRRADES